MRIKFEHIWKYEQQDLATEIISRKTGFCDHKSRVDLYMNIYGVHSNIERTSIK